MRTQTYRRRRDYAQARQQTMRELRALAAAEGLQWADVVAAKNILLDVARESRENQDEIRRRAWELYCHYNYQTKGCWPFWRCGFDHVQRRLEKRDTDHTAIRCYDMIATGIGCEFPEWQDRSSEEFWQAMFEPYRPFPPREQFYREAIDEMVRGSIKIVTQTITDEPDEDF